MPGSLSYFYHYWYHNAKWLALPELKGKCGAFRYNQYWCGIDLLEGTWSRMKFCREMTLHTVIRSSTNAVAHCASHWWNVVIVKWDILVFICSGAIYSCGVNEGLAQESAQAVLTPKQVWINWRDPELKAMSTYVSVEIKYFKQGLYHRYNHQHCVISLGSSAHTFMEN